MMRAVSLGGLAARSIRRDQRLRVIAAFERSVHLEAGSDVICLVAPELGNGPLNALLAQPASWPRVGQWVEVIAPPPRLGEFGVGRLRDPQDIVLLDCTSAAIWHAPEPDFVAAPASRQAALDELNALAVTEAPFEGLARLTLSLPVEDCPLVRVARPKLERLRGWLSHPVDAPPTDLLGLGPGLTPSGDDFICGVLIALAATQQSAPVAALTTVILAAAPTLTSRLSCAFLAAAAEGEGAEALHLVINALVEGRVGDVAPRARAAGLIGHTSGWDALAGAAMALAGPV